MEELRGGVNLLSYDDTNNLFILNKDTGRDLYTSTDLITYTPINGALADNQLKSVIQRQLYTLSTLEANM